MILLFRNRTVLKLFIAFTLFSILGEVIAPTVAWALTSGPSQPEVQSFKPIGASDMVDLFTGDFSYSLPLFEMGGYPINLSYHGGISMDQEASWVGLGWNLNPGAITRSVRGIPDDFNGEDQIKKSFNMRPNETTGLTAGLAFETFGSGNIGLAGSLGVFHNNYQGIGFTGSLTPSISAGMPAQSHLTAGLGLSANSQSGVDVSPSLSFSRQSALISGDVVSLGTSLSTNYNTRSGLKTLSLQGSISAEKVGKDKKGRDRRASVRLGSTSGSVSFGDMTYTPSIPMPTNHFAFSVKVKIGGEVLGLHPHASLQGYYSRQTLTYDRRALHAFGYMHAEKGQSVNDALHDFNREKDGSFSQQNPNLPLANRTYDLFSMDGHGLGGSFHAQRSDVGVVYDPFTVSSNSSQYYSAEIGAGPNLGHIGGDITAIYSAGYQGPWQYDNDARVNLEHQEADYYSDPAYEPYYFKMSGEMNQPDNGFLNDIAGTAAVRVPLSSGGLGSMRVSTVDSKFVSGNNDAATGYPVSGIIRKTQREKRNHAIQMFTAEEAQDHGIETSIFDATGSGTEIDRVGGHRKAHHLSQAKITAPDGRTYIYGVPAYTLSQKEVSYNVGCTLEEIAGGTCGSVLANADCETGLIPYDSDDASTANDRGIDNYYQAIETDPYVHSLLISHVLSADYVDVDQNGPSPNDLGSYVNFDYLLVNGIDAGKTAYRWRTPFAGASYDEGLKSDPTDDKASYLFGTKELYYLNRIRSKDYIAEFYTSGRDDGYESSGESGGIGTQRMRRLDSIKVFTIAEYERAGTSEDPVPEKMIEFVYANDNGTDELCEGIPNHGSNGGKLTLREVRFTYKNSPKGSLTPYRFHYEYEDRSPSVSGVPDFDYNTKTYDRWGNYKPHGTGVVCAPGASGNLSNSDDPYTDQSNPGDQDIYAVAWHLTAIDLPSGGRIEIDLEADTYQYVQNRRAMQMTKIAGFSDTDGASSFEDELYDENANYNYLYFPLHTPIPSNLSSGEIQAVLIDEYFDPNRESHLYFRCLVNVTSPLEPKYEYVIGYAEIESIGVAPASSGMHSYAWLKLKEVSIGDNENGNVQVPAIAKAAWQMTRLYLPRYVYPNSYPDMAPNNQAIRALAGLFSDIGILFKGFNRTLRSKHFARETVPDKSFIRLYNPNRSKIGGGSRVKEIRVYDNWDQMTANQDVFFYGQSYDYTIRQALPYDRDNDGEPDIVLTSSGVAAYEPAPGNDENPFRKPVFYPDQNVLAPDNRFYQEEPMGETLFPAPVVGYSQVTVRSLERSNVSRTATGKVVHTFYTARDFPTIVRSTRAKAIQKRSSLLAQLLKVQSRDYMTASQGYTIEQNNMHGQQRGMWVYAEDQDIPISGKEYVYQTDPANPKQLNNEVLLIQPDGSIVSREIGLTVNMVSDMREHKNIVIDASLGLNLDGFLLGIFPLGIPTVWPSLSAQETRFRSAVTTKVVFRSGILKKVINHDRSAQIEHENLAYDSETGQVMLSRTWDEYGMPLYNFSFPTHWAYDGMGPAYQNVGLRMENLSVLNGYISPSFSTTEIKRFFSVGDQLAVYNNQGSFLAHTWVAANDGTHVSLIDQSGNAYGNATGLTFVVIRSGRKNQQSFSIGSVSCRENPIQYSGAVPTGLDFSSVYQADAVVFRDQHKRFCYWGSGNCGNPTEEEPYNPFALGLLGIWRPQASYSYLINRAYEDGSSNALDIRDLGQFADFDAFWQYNTTTQQYEPQVSTEWIRSNLITAYHPRGAEIENRDPLGNYSAAIFGYAQSLPVAVGNNTQYRQMATEGFEDYELETLLGNGPSPEACGHPHSLDFNFGTNELSATEAHTGLYSLFVNPSRSVGVSPPCDGGEDPEYSPEPDPGPSPEEYLFDACECQDHFAPPPGRYYFSAWVKEKALSFSNDPVLTYTAPEVVLVIDGNPTSLTPSGTIIEGWQKIEGEFTVDPGESLESISFENTKPSTTEVYFDDIRIHPFSSNMNTYVYHPYDRTLMAQLDENNYATLYEYDEEGALVRRKKETVEGIITLEESRRVVSKIND